MHVASLELCKELYELSQWSDNGHYWGEVHKRWGTQIPAYDLGFLLRKLPDHVYYSSVRHGLRMIRRVQQADNPNYLNYVFRYGKLYEAEADTPEDALVLLAISLFKAGLLKQQEPKGSI